jgi:hypothetical protein
MRSPARRINRCNRANPNPQDLGKFGLQVRKLTKDVAERLHLSSQQGVIEDVEENSIAVLRALNAKT